MICQQCGKKNDTDAVFCVQCSQSLLKSCPSCSTQNPGDARFCKQCRAELGETSIAAQTTKLQNLRDSAPEGLQEKLRLAQTEIEGQRKPVTILFADIVGSTSIAEKLDPEEWKEVVQGAHHRVSEAIYRYEGTIAQLLGDGVLAFFGAPLTHENDPERAVRAALDLQESIVDYRRQLVGFVDDFHMRVGIHVGEVVVGQVGTDEHAEYLAIGDTVNVAARIESAAQPGEVLVSETCVRLIEHVFDVGDLKSVKAKGKTEPIGASVVLSLKAEPSLAQSTGGGRTPFVGRSAEISELKQALAKLCQGQGQIVSILGDAGIGKSRLLEHVYQSICESKDQKQSSHFRPSSIRWLEGRALSYGASLSFWTINQLLLSDLALTDGAPEAKIIVALRRRLKDLFGDEYLELMPFLAHLLGVELESANEGKLRSLDRASLRLQTIEVICRYFTQAAGHQPTVLIFDDLHWADPSSLETLKHLMKVTDRAALMILCLTRVERSHASWNIKLRAETDFSHRYTEIFVKRLEDNESRQFVLELLGVLDLPEDIQHLVMTRSEGNPFYLEEVIHHLIERGFISRRGDRWAVAPEVGEIGVPETLQGILLTRIDRLEENIRRTLQMASVIGRSFQYRLLNAISDAEKQLEDHLSQLQRLDLVREKSRQPELEYIFKHSLTQEAAYESLLIERRKEFHLRVANALQELFPDHAEEFFGLMAYHWERGGNKENALKYHLLAGERAQRLHAHLEALGDYSSALELVGEEDLSFFFIVHRRALVLLELYQGELAVNDFERIHKQAIKTGNQKDELDALLGLAKANYIIALDEKGGTSASKSREYYEDAYTHARKIGDNAGMVKALVPTMYLSDYWPDYEKQARANAEEALELSLGLGDEELILDSKLAIFYTGALFDRKLGEILHHELEAREDITRLNTLQFYLMWAHLRIGDFHQTVKTCELGMTLAEKIGVPPVQYPTLKALALLNLGRFDEARRSLDEEVADEAHRLGRAFKELGLGVYYLELMAYEQAIEKLESTIKQATLLGRVWMQNYARISLVKALAESGLKDHQYYKDNIKSLENMSKPIAMVRIGESARVKGKLSEAIEIAEKAESLAKEAGFRPDAVHALMLKAQSSSDMGMLKEALTFTEEAIRLAEEMSYLPMLWRILGLKADVLMQLKEKDRSEIEYQKASKVIYKLAENISDDALRLIFMSSRSVTSVLTHSSSLPKV
jgi:class 3 adenylate cyclase/tetratricopeptide (TPR) repeat protein